MKTYRMEVYGHRGAGGEAPENTIAGCRHAISRGVRHIEIDLRLSADDELVVIHDKTVSRTTYSRGRVSSFTTAELAELDARKDGPPWPEEHEAGVPSLDILIDATPQITRYQLEVKDDAKPKMKLVAERLAERFPTPEQAEKVVVTSSNYDLHNYLQAVAPYIARGMVAMKLNAYPSLQKYSCQYFCMHWSACNLFLVRELRRAGVYISVWTVNDVQLIKNLYRMKIDSIITDYPSMALPLIASLARK